jgi:hypothetical protein
MKTVDVSRRAPPVHAGGAFLRTLPFACGLAGGEQLLHRGPDGREIAIVVAVRGSVVGRAMTDKCNQPFPSAAHVSAVVARELPNADFASPSINPSHELW